MALVVSDTREVDELELILNNALTLRLYVNDVTPTGNTVQGDLTECTSTGYSAESLTYGNWTIQEVSNQAEATYPQVEFSMPALSGALTVYGYYVTDASGLAWSERFASSLVFSSGVNAVVRINLERTYRTQV